MKVGCKGGHVKEGEGMGKMRRGMEWRGKGGGGIRDREGRGL